MLERRILIIDDDPALTDTLADIVSDLGFSAVCALSGSEGLEFALTQEPVVILLDLKLPDLDGMEICRQIRAISHLRHIPILIITGNDNPEVRVTGLNSGADDYICKPFHREEVQARIRAVLRRTPSKEQKSSAQIQELKSGNLRIDVTGRLIFINDDEVRLTGTELKVLIYLLSHPDEVIDKQTLLSEFWGSTRVTSRTIDTHVANIRRKLKDWNRAIETVHGAGYVYRTLKSSTRPEAA